MATSTTIPQTQQESGLKERFFRYFQHEVTEQMGRLNNTSWSGGERADAVDHCLAGIDRLSLEVKDASSYIPTYDQRTYGDAIKALSEKLQHIRNEFAPPKKFQFKTARKNNSAISLSDAAELAKQNKLRVPGYTSENSNTNSSFAPTPLEKLSPTEEKAEPNLSGTDNGQSTYGIRKLSTSNETSVTVTNHNRAHILLPTSAKATSSAVVSNIRHSVVDLSPPTTSTGPFAGLILKNIKASLIVCGHVAGPVHITGVENSVVVVASRQLRIHSSKNVSIYLYCSSRPIIEDCDGIQFSPLPQTYTTSSMNESTNHWDQIDDFEWLKSEPSPHFSLLSPTERIEEAVWTNIVPGGHSVSLDDILKAVQISL